MKIKHLLFIPVAIISLNYFLSKDSSAESNFDILFGNSTAYEDVVVRRVIRADLIELENNQKVRLIGLHAAIYKKPSEPLEKDKYGFVIEKPASPIIDIEEEAYNFVKELLEGKHVRLEFDVSKKDDDHHNFAYVFLKDKNIFVNEEILRQGYAQLQIQPPNLKYATKLREAYQQAYKERRGLQNR